MRLFYQSYPPATISESLIRKSAAADPTTKSVSPIRNFSLQELAESLPLSWTHYVHLIRRTRSPEERSFYEAEALRGGWSVRQLDRQIGSQFYTRALTSKNKGAMLDEGGIAQRGDAMTHGPEQPPELIEVLVNLTSSPSRFAPTINNASQYRCNSDRPHGRSTSQNLARSC